jgi:hypothetical protein
MAKAQRRKKATSAIKANEKQSPAAAEEADRWRYYGSIPKGHWVRLSGRQHKTLNEQAARYAIPIAGATIDLAAVARWLHDFLAKNARNLGTDSADPLLAAGGSSPALERYRDERANLARLDRLEREHTLVDRELSHQAWQRVAGVLHRCGEVLQRQFGPAALRLLNQALEDGDREVVALFADGDPVQTDQADDRKRSPRMPRRRKNA